MLVLAVGVADASGEGRMRTGHQLESDRNDMRPVSRSKIRCHCSGPVVPTRAPPAPSAAGVAPPATMTATGDSERAVSVDHCTEH